MQLSVKDIADNANMIINVIGITYVCNRRKEHQ